MKSRLIFSEWATTLFPCLRDWNRTQSAATWVIEIWFVRAGPSARFNDGRFRVTAEAQLRALARFVFTGHWPL